MSHFVISGMGGLDGRYEFDLADLDMTLREWQWIKRHTGYMPLTLIEGLAGGDAALMTVTALIIVRRQGGLATEAFDDTFARFMDAPLGPSIDFTLEGVDEDEDPSTASPPTNSTASDAPSGPPGPTSGPISIAPLPPTGTHGWDSSGSA